MSMFSQPSNTGMPQGGPQFPNVQPQWSNQVSLANAQRVAQQSGEGIKSNILQFAKGQTPQAAQGAATAAGVQNSMGKLGSFANTEVLKNLRTSGLTDAKPTDTVGKVAADVPNRAKIARWAANAIVKSAMGVPQTGYPQPGAAPMPPQGPPAGTPAGPGAPMGSVAAQGPMPQPMPAQGPGGAMMLPPGPPMGDPAMMGAAPPQDPSMSPVPAENAQLAPDDQAIDMPVLTGMAADPDAEVPEVDEAMKYDKMVTASDFLTKHASVNSTFEKQANPFLRGGAALLKGLGKPSRQ